MIELSPPQHTEPLEDDGQDALFDMPDPAETAEANKSEIDSGLITDDIEILGESLHLRRSAREASHKISDILHASYNTARDTASIPGNFYRNAQKNKNGHKIERLKQKIAANPDAPHFEKERQWIKMYEARSNHHDRKIRKSIGKSEKRAEKLSNKNEAREQRYQKHIDEYIHKKIDAVRKKQYRRLQKQEGIGRYNRGMQAEFFRRLPDAEKRAITLQAILAVRQKNIRKGKLDEGYDVAVDNNIVRREIDNYERAVR